MDEIILLELFLSYNAWQSPLWAEQSEPLGGRLEHVLAATFEVCGLLHSKMQSNATAGLL